MEAGDGISTENASWTFKDENVVKNFDQHVKKSVPFYEEGHDLVVKLSDFFVKHDSVCYEIGCSSGKLITSLAERHSQDETQFIGIDNSDEMISFAKLNRKHKNIKYECGDALTFDYCKADLIVAYYTVQFIHPKSRQILLDIIYKNLNWGGALILFEKVRASDARFQDIMSLIYTDYKIEKGYTTSEVINKAKSLKGVLEPFSTEGNKDSLKRAGFKDIMTVMKYICWEGFLAIK